MKTSEQRRLMNRISWRMGRIYHSTLRLRWRELELITLNRSSEDNIGKAAALDEVGRLLHE